MKKSELIKIIKEEVKALLFEGVFDSTFGLKGSGGLRDKAHLDILSQFVQPQNPDELGGDQYHLLSQAKLRGWAIKGRINMGPDYNTSATDYRQYRGTDNNPIPIEVMVKDTGMRPDVVEDYDFLDYMLQSAVELGFLKKLETNKHPDSAMYMLSPNGAKRFKELFANQQQSDPNQITQLGKERELDYEPSPEQEGEPMGRPFDVSRYVSENISIKIKGAK